MGLCGGFAIPVAQRMGANEPSKMRRYVANSAYLAALFSLLLTTATGLLCRTILTVMRTPADIFDNAYTYIFIIFMGIPATILYNLLAGILRSLGDSKTPVVFLALSSFLNIFLDFALILWFDAGVAGAAIATVVSQGISGVACLCYMAKKYPILRMSREERRLDIHSCRVLCAMGIPMGLQYSITAIGSIILQSSVNALGSLYVAAVAAGAQAFSAAGLSLRRHGSHYGHILRTERGSLQAGPAGPGHPLLHGAGAGLVPPGAVRHAGLRPSVRHALPGPQ